jgi:N-acetylglucosamine kinase-like BadF-type ATPase
MHFRLENVSYIYKMTRCSVGRATQKYRGNGTDLSDILETPGDIIYADAAVSAENLVISGTTGDVLKVSASGIPEWGASTSQWITSGDDISYSLGHVGIGTTSPDANLHVTGNAFVSTDLGLGGTLTMGNVLVEALHELSAITATGNVTPHVIEFTNPTTGLVTTGNVGIGTSSPLETLDVYGGFLVRPERTTAFYDNAWTGTSPTNFTAGGPITGPTINVIYSKNAIYTTTGGLKVSPPNTDTEYYYERGFNFVYSPFGSYYTHFPASGSVTSPYLSGDVFSSTRFKADNTEDFTGFAIGQDYEAGVTLTDYSQSLDIARAHSAHMYFKTASSDGSLTEKMRITNTGNVGIGTPSPNANLHVEGNVYVSSNLEVSNINFTGSFNQNGTPFESSPWTTTGDDLSYTTGRVGVGTSSPDANLHVEGNVYVSSNLEVSNINFTGSFNQNGTPFESSPWTTTGDDLSYTTGRVGVGTSSPDANLHVEGNVFVSSKLNVGPLVDGRVASGVEQQQKIQASDAQAYDYFGHSVSLSSDGNTALVGALEEDTGGTRAGAAYIFIRSGGTWSQQQKIQASDPETNDYFGYSVSLSGDGNTALIGAIGEGTGAADAGAVYVFTRSGGTWSQQQKIQASDAQAYDSFGYSVSLSSDGNTALIGARYEDTGATDAGAAYIFIRSGGTWTQQQKIQASDPETSDQFGNSVSLSSDGNTALIGARSEDTGAADAGAAYVFTRSGVTWSQQQKIQASDPETGDSFGYSVSLSSDGNTALIGARYEDTGAASAGAAYVFILSGGTWTQQQKIQASDPEASDSFGNSVSLSSDGNTALVGAFEEDTGATTAGAAYMFIRYSGTWTQQYKIQASDPETSDRFGYSVSLSSDGNTALIGARSEDTGATDAGAAYIFIRSLRTVLCADTTTSRVGVGTTSPNYTLDVAGDLTCSGTMRHRAFAFFAWASGGQIVASRGILSDSNSIITTVFDYTPAGTASTNGFRSSGGVSNNQGTYFAPVDGIYHVSCKVRLSNGSNTVQEIQWYIKRTNGNEVPWEGFEMWISPPDAGGHRASMSSTIVKLAKDEGIFPRGDGPTTSLISATFGGHFLGTY